MKEKSFIILKLKKKCKIETEVNLQHNIEKLEEKLPTVSRRAENSI
jgi:hypothetical protein